MSLDTPPDSTVPDSTHKTTTPSRKPWIIPGAVGLIIGLVIGSGVTIAAQSGDSDDSRPAAASNFNDAEPVDEPTEEATEEPVAVPPTVDQFAVKLRIKERHCFGSAGCNVTVGVEPSFTGFVPPDGTWDITYEVRGAEDGAVIQTFKLEDDQFNFSPEISLSTTSARSKLSAVVTDVVEGY